MIYNSIVLIIFFIVLVHKNIYSYKYHNIGITKFHSKILSTKHINKYSLIYKCRQLYINNNDKIKEQIQEMSYIIPSYLLELKNKISNQKITISDIVTYSGLEFNIVKRDLLLLASMVGATLEVIIISI